GLAFVVGCTTGGTGEKTESTDGDSKEKGEEHRHEPGKHGGTVVEIRRDNYHAEVIFGEKGLGRLHMLGKDDTQMQEVDRQTLVAFAKAEGDTKAVKFTLEPKPQHDDSKGKTSIFEGTLPESVRDKRIEVTVTTIRIKGSRFRFTFKNFKEDRHGSTPTM